VCIEPFENLWLEQIGVDDVVRQRVENIPLEFFACLQSGDILFIDSSHVLRTGGDVFHEYLRILPTLRQGVLIHVHDIFLPFDYPRDWIVEQRHFWTEQYVLQAFLAFNSAFGVLLAASYLAAYHRDALAAVCPVFAQQERRVPGSFWLERL